MQAVKAEDAIDAISAGLEPTNGISRNVFPGAAPARVLLPDRAEWSLFTVTPLHAKTVS